MEECLLNEEEVARMLKVSPKTLQKWRQQGVEPKFMKLGRGLKAPVRYKKSDVMDFINNSTVLTIDGSRKINRPTRKTEPVTPKAEQPAAGDSEADKLIRAMQNKIVSTNAISDPKATLEICRLQQRLKS